MSAVVEVQSGSTTRGPTVLASIAYLTKNLVVVVVLLVMLVVAVSYTHLTLPTKRIV